MPYTLLLADDSVTIQRVIELTFADEDVTVVAVGDGDQAIERLQSSPPDIVLADIGMPGKNGYEVAQYIRQSPALAHIPVMLLTGAFEPVDHARADQAGCDGVLAKPFEPQLVIGRVKELLARSHRSAEPAAIATTAVSQFPTAVVPPPLSTAGEDTSWAPSSPERQDVGNSSAPATPETSAPAAPPPVLNDYFDRLDAAFSQSSPIAPVSEPTLAVPQTDLNWFRPAATEPTEAEPWHVPDPSAPEPPPTFASTASEPSVSAFQSEPSFRVAEEVVHARILETAPFVTNEPLVQHEPFVRTEPVDDTEPAVEVASTVDVEPLHGDQPTGAPAWALVSEPIAAPDERLSPIEESAPVDPDGAPPADPPFAPTAATPDHVAPGAALQLPLSNPAPLPALADAFAALLAAEQGEPAPVGSLWPASGAANSAVPAPTEMSEELIEAVTRRVLDRLSDTVVRQAVSEMASQVAERLIREEIERIKASIK